MKGGGGGFPLLALCRKNPAYVCTVRQESHFKPQFAISTDAVLNTSCTHCMHTHAFVGNQKIIARHSNIS